MSLDINTILIKTDKSAAEEDINYCHLIQEARGSVRALKLTRCDLITIIIKF